MYPFNCPEYNKRSSHNLCFCKSSDISFIEKSKDQYETINLTSNTTFGYYFFSNIGYRYISTKGFLFRIGLSPSFSFNDKHGVTKEPFIYPYISFGYSF